LKAVSNAIGSNVFDILVCLGLPWFVKCMTLESGRFIVVKSRGLTYSSLTLFATVIILLGSLHINKWNLDKKIGTFLLLFYFGFLVLNVAYEMDIFDSNNLPMCLNSEW
jgi:sodium/potassium/calcium exchanger 4